jgi:hypothetical protein
MGLAAKPAFAQLFTSEGFRDTIRGHCNVSLI